MAAAETPSPAPTVDLTSTTNSIKESNSKLDYAAAASAHENKQVVDSIDNWAKSNSMDISNLAMSNLSGDTAQMNAVVDALAAQMDKDEMGAGQMYDGYLYIQLEDQATGNNIITEDYIYTTYMVWDNTGNNDGMIISLIAALVRRSTNLP